MPPPTNIQLGKAILKHYAPSITFPFPTPPTTAVPATCASTSSLPSIRPLFQLIHDCARRVDPQTHLYIFGSTRVYGFNEASAPTAGAPPASLQGPTTPVMPTKPVKNDVDIAALSAADVAVHATSPHASEGHRDAAVDRGTELTKSLQVDFLEKLKTKLRMQSPHREAGSSGDRGPTAKLSWEMEVVKRARVPVLRIQPHPIYSSTEPTTEAAALSTYNADVTYGRRCGVLNSALLRRYIDQQPHLRYLCLVVKRWSKLTGLNTATSPDGSGLTSYGFHLLIVYYALRRQLVQYVAPESIVLADVEPVPASLPLFFPGEAHEKEIGNVSLMQYIEKDEAAAARVGEWALDFIRFYLHEFDYDQEVVSISRGADRFASPTDTAANHPTPNSSTASRTATGAPPPYLTKEMLHWTKQEEYQARSRGEYLFYRFCIEDPYETNLNVGRHMSSVKLMIFKKHLEKALETGLSFFPAEDMKKTKKDRVKPNGKK